MIPPAAAEPSAGRQILGPVRQGLPEPDIGRFEQGTPASRWALARYLTGRAIGDSALASLLLLAVLLVAVAAAVGLLDGPTFVLVILVLLAVGVFGLWALARAVLRRLTGAGALAPIRPQLDGLVRETRGDVRRELHRVGLPSTALTLPLLGFRLLGRRRPDTVQRLRGFEVARVVPAARIDQIHLLLDQLPR